MTEKQIKEIASLEKKFGKEFAASIAKLYKAANDLDTLTEQVVANSKAFQAECKEDMKKIKAH